MANKSIILNPLLMQALIICEETIAVIEPNILMKPIPMILT